jgi:bacterioferritin-associated ferredoxin
MYVCLCKGITDKDIRNAAKGASSSREILKNLGVATDCGICLEDAIKIYTESNNKPSSILKAPTNTTKNT